MRPAWNFRPQGILQCKNFKKIEQKALVIIILIFFRLDAKLKQIV